MARQTVPVIGVPVPAPWHLPKVPRKRIALWAIVLIALAALAFAANAAFSRISDEPATPAVPAIQPVAQPVQLAPVVEVAPIVKEWPKVEVVWSEPFLINSLTDLPPSLPAGEGFYRETSDGVASAHSSPEAQAYLREILPQLITEGFGTWPVIAGIARDTGEPNVVFAGFHASHINLEDPRKTESHNFFFLSIDGGGSWYEILPDTPSGYTLDVRVARDGKDVVLFARDPGFIAPMWRKAVLPLKSLPQ